MKIKADYYYNDGIFEMARFGKDTIMKNHMNEEQHKLFMEHLKLKYEPKKREIDALIVETKDKVVRCNPIELLSTSSDMFLLNNIEISSELQLSQDTILVSHMTEYIQSILVSSENKYVLNEDDQSCLIFETLEDIKKIIQFN